MKRHAIVSTCQKKHKCIYCNYTSDQSNNVKRYMKRHENKPPQKVVTENHPTLDVIALENIVAKF